MRIKQVNHRNRQFSESVINMYPELTNSENGIMTKNITFVVTEACNLRCTYCYQCDKDHHKVMSKEEAKKAVDMILDKEKIDGYIDYDKEKFVILDFIGGEPLLAIDIMDYIVDYFRYKTKIMNHPWHNRYMISFSSNGMLYKDEKVQAFIKKNSGRVSVGITIDGDKELHDSCRLQPDGTGSYDIVEEAIKMAIEQVGLTGTKITLAPENIMFLSKSLKHLYDLGLTELNANCVFEDVWVPERDAPIFYNQLIELADWIIDNQIYEEAYCSLFDDSIGHSLPPEENQNWCGGDASMLAIGTDGNVYPCIRYMKYSLSNKDRKEICIGNTIKGIDKKEDNKELNCLCNITRRSQSTDECFNCPVASGCAW